MIDDPILDEIHRFREEHAARFDYDLDAIVRDLQIQEAREGRPLLTFEPRPALEISPRAARGTDSGD